VVNTVLPTLVSVPVMKIILFRLLNTKLQIF
jgi:hypothetical protein